MRRRTFLEQAARGIAVAGLARAGFTRRASAMPKLAELPALEKKFTAADRVTLGKTGVTTSRLAMGTGTVGGGHHSNQTALGVAGLAGLLMNGYDQGLHFIDAADSYGSHPHAAAALKQMDRSKVTVMTKSFARDPQQMRADIDRYRRELGVEYIDVFLMHCLTEGDWTTRYRGVMDVIEEAKQKGVIRTHGCSCHSIEALRAAAASPWVEVDLVRINPVGASMDADPETVVGVMKQMKASGKALIGMKILGAGVLRTKQDEALKYALGLNLLDSFTIGAESVAEQNDLLRRISAAA
jgi:aryl-alcohol dehydrogenase-like predicted oxidoreductase